MPIQAQRNGGGVRKCCSLPFTVRRPSQIISTVLNTSDDDNGDDEDTKRVIITKKLEET